ncbi:nuclear pore complex protein Nup160 homolog isoform X2 [Anoplophora glabripennis]|uniref:nuclear pore complex protein Nup160 homolog isoform X2 n=1 Tax=Anoplophora glabripennis TaxID=217634 RepID=UPI00087569CA|nr:nuclear pore complex protein Nup160 homolog isoform X2 [Anoplophora glabripennis]
MTAFTLSYREVISDQTLLENWREITLSTGGTQSTLQDIKVAERANGFCYEDSTKHHTRNRFIYWRINYDVLELVEHSLDVNLTGNRVRYRFIDTPILDGISVHETYENVIVLVPTVCSVHRLIFPHPDRFHRQDDLLGTHPELPAPSIFCKASASDARNSNTFYVFNNPSTANDQLPNLACSYLLPDTEEAIFALAYPSTELLLIKQSSEGQAVSTELKGDSLMPRFLTGLAEKFRQKNLDGDNVVSLSILIIDGETYILSLCRNGHLKFWSCSKGQCVAVIDILAETGDIAKDRVQGAVLRKSVDETSAESILAVFMSFASGCQFHILKPFISGQQIRIVRLNTLHSLENDLIDFALQTNRLWSAWRCEDGECLVYTASLQSDTFKSNSWTPVILETLPDANQAPTTDGESDPRQVYLQHIFSPGKFPLHIISKALSIYKRSTILTDTHATASGLKQRICMAVENEIQNTLNGSDINDDEYLECAEWCWQKFYSCCVQYHIASLKPLGLMLLPSVSGAVFLKKSTFSFLRPLDPLEHMMLCSDYMYKDQFVNFSMLAEDMETTGDVMNLFETIVYLEQQMSEIFSQTFEKELFNLQVPDVVMESLLEKIQSEMDSQVSSMLSQVFDLYKAIHKVLELLRYENTLANPDNEINPSAMYHFSSQLGVSVVAACLRQQAQIRFQICRNLLLICNILLKNKEKEWGVLEAIRSVCTPEIVVLTQASYIMLWLSGLPALVNLPHESSIQRLTPIKLTPVFNLRFSTTCVSLLELFTASSGGEEARKSFARVTCSDEALAHWHLSLLPYLNHLRHIIWPISGGTVLAEWLLSSGQHLWLQQYVRLLSNWCEWNSCTRSFLLAASFLTSGENYKAQELFQAAAKGIFSDSFLEQRILRTSEDNPTKAYINYYLKVIQLLELHKARDCAINMANTALSIVEPDNPLSATLYSIKFKHHLALKHYKLAFESLNSNPDAERKKDNLRDLVKTLLDEKKLDILLNFTYGSMDEFFTNILLTRARATDGVNNVFYDFLYSYQIKRGPLSHRLAASVMYEQAFRLLHLNTADALEKQVKCYLAAKNVLQLCKPEFAWVVRPADPEEEVEEVVLEPVAGSNKELQVLRLRKQVEVININTIRKDLVFASAKLKLARFDATSPTNITSPVELVTLLNNSGLFKTSLDICTTFNLPYNSIFETLTKHCILLTEQEHPSAWNWLVENDLQDLPVNRDSAADVVWQLLQEYLEKYEEPNMTTLHYVVCKKIIQMRIYVPQWLLASYKNVLFLQLRNAPELLRLLHSSGRLEEAIELVNEYLLAALGYGKEFYGFDKPLVPSALPFCLPVYAIRNLIRELEIQNTQSLDKPYLKECEKLTEIFSKYLETATRISNEMCQKKLSGGTIRAGAHVKAF